MKKKAHTRFPGALAVLSLALALAPPRPASASGLGAAPALGSAASGYGGMVPPATAISNAEIAKGQQNQQQGEQKQDPSQMAMGAMQIAQGLLGLLAAAEAANKGDQSGSRASDLSALSSGIGSGGSGDPYRPNYGVGGSSADSGTGTSAGGESSGPEGSLSPVQEPADTATGGPASTSASTIGLSPQDLRVGILGKSMDGIERNFGIPRDKFVDALKAGVNPKDLLANAPKNAPSLDTLGRIEAGLASQNTAAQDLAKRILASSSDGAKAGGAPASGSADESNAVDSAKAAKSASPQASSSFDFDAVENMAVSPEVRNAMAARAAQLKADREKGEMHTWTLFQLVHSRYRKLQPMIFGRIERPTPLVRRE